VSVAAGPPAHMVLLVAVLAMERDGPHITLVTIVVELISELVLVYAEQVMVNRPQQG
jgi:hypothetical protein